MVVSFDQGSGMKLWHRRRNYHAGLHYIILNGEMTPLGRRSAPVWRNLRGKGGFTNFLLVAGGVPRSNTQGEGGPSRIVTLREAKRCDAGVPVAKCEAAEDTQCAQETTM